MKEGKNKKNADQTNNEELLKLVKTDMEIIMKLKGTPQYEELIKKLNTKNINNK